MEHRILRTFHWPTLLLAGALLTATGCSREPERSASAAPAASPQSQKLGDGKFIELGSLPFIEPEEASQGSLQRLEKGTPLEETTALHVRLPPPANKELQESLVRIVGQPESPTVLFNSDALARLGVIPSSPGREFFTVFSQFDDREVERRISNEKLLESGQQGEVSTKTVVFNGRTPVGITEGIAFDRVRFDKFLPMPLSLCPATPVSTWAGWGQSLFIKDPAVVLNAARTWDPCTGAGTQGGVWTFAHLIREMATGSGFTAEDFVVKWLEMWLNDYTVNGDVVAARINMYNQVISPWATASGISAGMLVDGSGHVSLVLSGPLNLNIAPFRLLSIVNRMDLGKTGSGSSGYGGTTTARPLDAGELRFIFGVVQPSPWGGGSQATCGLKPFTVIFEYGVPITGCGNVVQYARKWTELNTLGGFTATYMTKLQAITESVVVHGAAPSKGNQSALNQLRTNEATLAGFGEWELREFTLTNEDPSTGTDVPSNGLLRKHTVAQTPDDGTYTSTGDPTIDNYVLTTVRPSVALPVGPLPTKCSSAHSVPYAHTGLSFRGGNSLAFPSHWEASSANPADAQDVCARHQFSLNTCNGCHVADTQTGFTHVSTSGIPVSLSNFLTGGGPGMAFGVLDTQFPGPTWPFADLERRWKRMHDIAFCVQCTRIFPVQAEFMDRISEISGVVPIDPLERSEKPRFKIGPIVDLEQVRQILESRPEFVAEPRDEPVDFIRTADTFVH